MPPRITRGFSDEERTEIAALYWQAFGAKLGKVMGPDQKALEFLKRNVDPQYALVARDGHGTIMGDAGYKTAQGAFVGGDMRALAEVYGWLSMLWRAPMLALVERELEKNVLLMDGICVAYGARGQWIGTALLNAVKNHAKRTGCNSVRLDVIDTNSRARALYEREGFRATEVQRLGPLSLIFGFSKATQMVWR